MPEHPSRLLVLVAAVALATVVVAGCAAGPPAAGSPVGAVGFLDGNLAPQASGYWGLVNINITPAS